MRGWIILDWMTKIKRKKVYKRVKRKTHLKNNKLNILINGWNWKQLKVYKRDKRKIKKKNNQDQI